MTSPQHNSKGLLTRKRDFAYPTLVLTIVAIAMYSISSITAFNGNLAIGWAVFINAIMAYVLFTSMHEAGHLNISGKHTKLKWVDNLIGWISGAPLLAPFPIFKVIHFRHHAFTNDPEKDPDHWLASRNFFALIFHAFSIFPIYLIEGLKLLKGGERLTPKVINELKVGYVAALVMFAGIAILGFAIGWNYVLLLWILPGFIAQGFLAFAFDWLPHHPHEERSRYTNTRIHDIPGLDVLLLGQNYHLIHHLHPRIPFYHYKKSFHALEEKLEAKGTQIIHLTD